MMSKLRTGVMGCANIAERMVIPAIQASQHLQLVAVSSRTMGKARQYADKFSCEAIEGYDELLKREDIDVIYMPLPTGMHLEWAMKALEQGKHILLEKSLACNYADAKVIVEKAAEKKLLVQENFMFPYHRQFAIIEDLLKENKLGEIRCIRSSFGFPPFPDATNIRYQPALGGGALLDAGAYTIKVSQLLAGDVRVRAALLNMDNDRGVDVHGGIFMVNDAGVVIETAFGFDHYYQCELEIWGNAGKLTAERIFTAGPGVQPRIIVETREGREEIVVESDNHFVNLLKDFGRSVLDGSLKSRYGNVLQQAKLVQEVADLADRVNLPAKARTGKLSV